MHPIASHGSERSNYLKLSDGSSSPHWSEPLNRIDWEILLVKAQSTEILLMKAQSTSFFFLCSPSINHSPHPVAGLYFPCSAFYYKGGKKISFLSPWCLLWYQLNLSFGSLNVIATWPVGVSEFILCVLPASTSYTQFFLFFFSFECCFKLPA